MNAIIKILKDQALAIAIIGGMIVLGSLVNKIIVWQWLTNFFIIIRHVVLLFNFIFDIPQLWTSVGYGIFLLTGLYALKGIIFIIKWFK